MEKESGVDFPSFFYCDETYLTWNWPFQPFFSVPFSSIKYIHIAVLPSSPSISRTLFFSNWNSVPIKSYPPFFPSLSLLSPWICLLLVPQLSGVIQFSSFCDWQMLLFGSVIFLTTLDDNTLSFTLCLLSKNRQGEGIFEASFRGFILCTRTHLKFFDWIIIILKCICPRNSVWWPFLSGYIQIQI